MRCNSKKKRAKKEVLVAIKKGIEEVKIANKAGNKLQTLLEFLVENKRLS